MSTPTFPLDKASIVSRLRAAGCVFAEDEARLLLAAAATPADLAAMVEQRAAGRPIEQVIGWAEFCGLRIAIEPGVFVPRRRTEFLVRLATKCAMKTPGRERPGSGGGVVAIDLCCGSGAVAAALAAALGARSRRAELYATDIDPAAVRCAKGNLAAYGGRVYQGDLYGPLPSALRHRVSIVTANAPYVPSDDVALMPPEARLHEPRLALDGGPDGLAIQRGIAAEAADWLAPGGHLLIETSERQAARTAAVVTDGGLSARAVSYADLGATVVVGTRALGS
jgi:release factor glutamine methyltransferase